MVGSTGEVGRAAQVKVSARALPCVLFYGVGSLGLACLAAYVAAGLSGQVAVRPLVLAMAGAVFAAAQLARIYHRVPGEAIMLAWGELGVIVTLCLDPGRLAAGGRGRGRADRARDAPARRGRGTAGPRDLHDRGDHPRWGGGGHGGRSDGRPGLAAAGHTGGPGTARPDLPRRLDLLRHDERAVGRVGGGHHPQPAEGRVVVGGPG